MIRRILVAGALVLAIVGFAGSAAYAQDSYTPDSIDPNVAGTGASAGTGAAGTSTGSGTLPVTGSDSTENLVRVGVILLAAGGLLVFAVRQRSTVSTH
jgi:LPXTG-motif cell wall-anchored protein